MLIVKHKAKNKKQTFITNFKPIVEKNKDTLPIKIYNKKTSFKTTSWFSACEYKVDKVLQNNNIKNKFPKNYIKSTKVIMDLSNKQKRILNCWFDANTNMYNETLNYVRTKYLLYKHTISRDNIKNLNIKESNNFFYLRDKLKTIRDNIQLKSQLTNINTNTKIYTHILDYSIKQLISNIKSAVTNTLRGNFKRFRIKFWKHNRPSQTIEIEKQYIKNNKICPYIFGDIKYIYNKQKYQLPILSSNVKINYNKILDEYSLLIPDKCIPIKIEDKFTNTISLDPGLRTFMTGLSENNAVKLGKNVNKIIVKKIRRLNNINNNKLIPLKIKQKNERMINRKIEHMTDDLHWKVIKYLTNNYNNIFLGDMSAKSIVSKDKSILTPVQKVACLRTRYYVFQQRLEYKCMSTKTNYKLVDEMYTSKTCSSCGNYNDNLKAETNYNCINCGINIDRDINGCRNIYFKSKL